MKVPESVSAVLRGQTARKRRTHLLEEVGLALHRDHVHKVERVLLVVDLGVAERDEEAVGDKLDVLAHELGVHADEADRERVGEELLLDLDRLADDALDRVRVRAALEVREEEAGKVGVEALVARDELVLQGRRASVEELREGAREREREEDARRR